MSRARPSTARSASRADSSVETLAVSRRGFLASSAVLALCVTGCRAWTPNTRAAYALVTDPPPHAYRPVLTGIIRAVLPFEHPRFPAIAPADVEADLLRLFPIDQEARFLTLQRGLAMFDQVDLFPHAFAPMVTGEGERDGDEDERDRAAGDWVAHAEHADEQRYAAFLREWQPDRLVFSRLPTAAQRAYLTMWMRSSFAVRRQFARSAKSIVTITAYSMDAIWPAIGYRGPLLEEKRAPS